jgi:molybdopterin/thiamine biosynthesis adenylyltransferase
MWRSEIFLGEVSKKLDNKTILVAGCGADGSHAVLSLASVMNNSTNTKLIVADPDTYDDPNLGIQVVDRSQIGINKALATAEMIKSQFPNITVEAHQEGVTQDYIKTLLAGTDAVIDAMDISVTSLSCELHRQACKQSIPVVVPWSLGMGAAIIAFTTPGDYQNWGSECEQIAEDLEMTKYMPVARWLVDHPAGLTLEYIDRVLAGEAPTPTTFFGAAEGGHMAARWVLGYLLGEQMPEYPNAVITSTDWAQSNTRIINFADATRDVLLSLRGMKTS